MCVTAATFSLMKYRRMKDDPDHQVQGQLKLTKDMSYYWNLANTWLTIGQYIPWQQHAHTHAHPHTRTHAHTAGLGSNVIM